MTSLRVVSVIFEIFLLVSNSFGHTAVFNNKFNTISNHCLTHYISTNSTQLQDLSVIPYIDQVRQLGGLEVYRNFSERLLLDRSTPCRAVVFPCNLPNLAEALNSFVTFNPSILILMFDESTTILPINFLSYTWTSVVLFLKPGGHLSIICIYCNKIQIDLILLRCLYQTFWKLLIFSSLTPNYIKISTSYRFI